MVGQTVVEGRRSDADAGEAGVTVVCEDAVGCAEAAGLRYVTDREPGIRRERDGDAFRYIGLDGREVDEPEALRRIRSLAVPPAYTDVWICPSPEGHLQATGRDARGRKQYRYHARWRRVRDATKFHRMVAFGGLLPRVRRQCDHDAARPGLPQEKVIAAIIGLLEVTLIRVGNEESARENNSFGLTTLHDGHVEVLGASLHFRFRGKSGKEHTISVRDRRLAAIVKRCREIPGHELFQYVDGQGRRQTVGSGDVNDYLRRVCGREFTAKDFRTWAGTVVAAVTLRDSEPPESQARGRKSIARAVETAAERLGNTPAVCRKCYVHPAIPAAYLEGTLRDAFTADEDPPPSPHDLRPEETAVLQILRRYEDERLSG